MFASLGHRRPEAAAVTGTLTHRGPWRIHPRYRGGAAATGHSRRRRPADDRLGTMEDDELVPLGEGPAATVLAGTDEATGEAFALKVYPGQADRRTRAELDKELSALNTLSGLGTVLIPTEAKEL